MLSIPESDMPVGINMQAGICFQELEFPATAGYASRMEPKILARNIAALRRHLGMNQTDFADLLGNQQANVSKWETKGVEPGAMPLSAMAEHAGVSVKQFSEIPWTAPTAPTKAVPKTPTLEDLAAEQGWVLIEEIDLALGMGATYLDPDRAPASLGIVPFKEDWLRDIFRGSVAHLKVVRGSGDSMEPTIRDGDFVLIDTSRRRLDEQDVIWALSYGDLGMIRRLRQMPGGSVSLMPDNHAVRPAEAFDGELWIMGRVVWIGRRM